MDKMEEAYIAWCLSLGDNVLHWAPAIHHMQMQYSNNEVTEIIQEAHRRLNSGSPPIAEDKQSRVEETSRIPRDFSCYRYTPNCPNGRCRDDEECICSD